MAREKFFQQLEKYVFGKLRSLPFSFEFLVIGLFVLAVSGSIVLFNESKTVLDAGAYPTEKSVISELIADASRRGDYETAEKVYEEQKVLGISSDNNLEYLVYPDRYVGYMANQFEKLVGESPYWRDGLSVLFDLYSFAGDLEKTFLYKERVEWLDPGFLGE